MGDFEHWAPGWSREYFSCKLPSDCASPGIELNFRYRRARVFHHAHQIQTCASLAVPHSPFHARCSTLTVPRLLCYVELRPRYVNTLNTKLRTHGCEYFARTRRVTFDNGSISLHSRSTRVHTASHSVGINMPLCVVCCWQSPLSHYPVTTATLRLG